MAIDRKKIKICLIGADGSGKTSISTILNKELPLSDIVWCGAESYIMRPIRYFLSLLSKTSRYTKQENLDNNSYRDFRSKRASFISQFSFLEPVYIFFVMLDYRLQYIFKVVKKLLSFFEIFHLLKRVFLLWLSSLLFLRLKAFFFWG